MKNLNTLKTVRILEKKLNRVKKLVEQNEASQVRFVVKGLKGFQLNEAKAELVRLGSNSLGQTRVYAQIVGRTVVCTIFETPIKKAEEFAKKMFFHFNKMFPNADVAVSELQVMKEAYKEAYDEEEDVYYVDNLPISFTIPGKLPPSEFRNINLAAKNIAKKFGATLTSKVEKQGSKYFVSVEGDEEQIDDFIYTFKNFIKDDYNGKVYGVDY